MQDNVEVSDATLWAVVPAAGIGSRMLADRPKQYLELDGKTVIEHTLQRLASHPKIKAIIVAVAKEDEWWSALTLELDCPIHVVEGGGERADSVYNGLVAIETMTENDPWVLVHDAARPCLRHEDIDQMLEQLTEHIVGGILGIPVTDTVKRTNEDKEIIETVSRQGLWRASTPQMYHLNVLKKSLENAQKQGLIVTDEASAIAHAGLQSMMVEGHADNIKITLPHDLALASLFLKQQREEG